ncbi:MAG TPA: dUTP diphosphatase [Clostridiales bacterium]|nr:dUTP diphosphatase [Clostridiales bacterium]
MNELKVKRLNKKASLPTRATNGSAGMDLYACIEQPVIIKPGDLVKIPTGIAVQLPSKDMGAFIFPRSGLAVKHGITLSNSVGVVDSDYRGEICVGLCNVGGESYTVKPQERIAQMVVMPVYVMSVTEAEVLDNTARGEGGFGSTGKL